MYKATNIDTDKALKAINDSRAIQERASQLRSEKERSYMEGLNKDCADIGEETHRDYRDSIVSRRYMPGAYGHIRRQCGDIRCKTQDS